MIKLFNECYEVVLTLLRRVNPISVAASHDLIKYILDKNTTQNSTPMPTSQVIIFSLKKMELST